MSDGVTYVPWEGLGRTPITIEGARGILAYSRESNERLIGLHGQDEEIREWAEFHDYEITGFARDLKVHSQSPPDERPGLSAAMEAVECGVAAGVAVRSLDRLARDFGVQDAAMRRIWDAGGRVFSCRPDYEWKPDKPGDPQWRLRRDYARMHEDQLHELLASLQGGRRRKMARLGYGGGHRFQRRYGAELVQIQGKLEWRPIPAEQAVIRRILVGCAGGRGYAAMAKALNTEGVPTVTGTPWNRKTIRDLALRGPDRLSAVPESLPVAQPLEWVRQQVAV